MNLVDRVEFTADVTRRVAAAHVDGRCAHIHVSGQHGVGKTDPVIEFAHRHRGEFAVVIWIDADALSAGETRQVLCAILRGFGVQQNDLGGEDAELLGDVRGLMAVQRVQLVVENVRVAATVRALQFDSPGSVVIVTSQISKPALGADSYSAVTVRPLSEPHAYELMTWCLRDIEVPTDPDLRARFFLCTAGFPLAIKICAAQLLSIPMEGVEGLREQVDALCGDGEENVVNMLKEEAYGRMEQATRRAYHLLSLHPGNVAPPEAVAALWGVSKQEAHQLMKNLAAQLLVEVDGGVYRLSPEWRAHATRLRDEHVSPEDCRAAVERVVRWYFEQTAGRDHVLSSRWRASDRTEAIAPIGSRDPALEWLERFQGAIVGAVWLADSYELHDLTWKLCEVLWGIFHLRRERSAWIETHERGLAAARAAKNPLAAMRMCLQLAAAYLVDTESRRDAEQWLDEADRLLDEAAEYARQADPSDVYRILGEQSIEEWRGKVLVARGRYLEAAAKFDLSWQIARLRTEIAERDRERIHALLRLQRGRARVLAGDLAGAEQDLSEAVSAFAISAETDNHAKALLAYGKLLTARGRPVESVPALERARDLLERDGSRRVQADAWEALAESHRALGDAAAWQDCLLRAIALYDGLGRAEAAARLRSAISSS